MDYFSVEITGTLAAYEEVDNGSIRFTDSNGITVDVPSPYVYQSRNWVPVRLPWMEPIPIEQKQMVLSKYDFLNLFTSEERILIKNTSDVNNTVEDIMFILNSADDIDLTNSQTIDSMNYFISIGLLTAERPSQILGGV